MEEAKSWNIYKKIQYVKCQLQEGTGMSGKNQFSKFSYLRLQDFLPRLNELNKGIGLFTKFEIKTDYNSDGVEIEKAVLTIVNIDTNPTETVVYSSKTAPAEVKGCTPIQNLGSIHTYMRRYLYVEAYDLAVDDDLDSRVGEGTLKEDTGFVPCSKAQIGILKKADSERVQKMLNYFKVKSIEELSVEQASQAINTLKKPAPQTEAENA